MWRSRGRPGPTAPGTPAEPQATSSIANYGCGLRQGQAAAGPSCGARGRRRGLAGQRADAPSHTSATRRRRCGGRRRVRRVQEGLAAVPVGGGGAWPDNEPTRRAKLAARTARGRAAAHRHTQRPGPTAPGTPAVPQRNEAATGCPAAASSRSRSAVHNSATSDQAVMSTWSSTAARPASRRATGTRNGEQDT